MARGKLKLVIAVLVLLAYTGQASAIVVAPCAQASGSEVYAMQPDMHEGMSHGSGMQHGAEGHHAHEAAENAPCECCDQMQCAMVQCSPAPAAAVDSLSPALNLFDEVFAVHHPSFRPAAIRAALYRPPISR